MKFKFKTYRILSSALVQDLTACALIIVTISLLYFKVSNFDFLNFDDNVYVTGNPNVAAGLSWQGVLWAASSTLGGHWHPLSWLSHMLDVSIFGMNPAAQHLVNIGFHASNSCLIYFIILLLVKNRKVAILSTLTFALHPLRMESVAWISQRKDLLSLLFGSFTVLLYLIHLKRGNVLPYIIALFTFALALLAKPTMITLPLLLIVIGVANSIVEGKYNKNFLSIAAQLDKLPFLVLAIISAGVALYSQALGGGLRDLNEIPLAARLNIALPAYLGYLGKLFWPFNTTIFYPIVEYPSGLAFGALISILSISLALWQLRRSMPELILGWSWFIIALVPMCGLVSIGAQALADRWTLTAHLGLIVALINLSIRQYKKSVYGHVAMILMLFTITDYELKHWKDSESIFSRALEINPNNFIAHTNLGTALGIKGNFSKQLYHYEEAARLNPTYPEALNNLGIARANQGRFNEAIFLFDKALSINPKLLEARQNLYQAQKDLELSITK